MSIEERKLKLIESVIKTDDVVLLSKVEVLFAQAKKAAMKKGNIMDFAGIWTEEEGEEFKRLIEEGEGCGHPGCLWKKLH